MKTGGGQCTVTLTPSEEKILSLGPNTVVGLRSRFDKDNAEPGPSGLRRWMTHEDEGDEQGSEVIDENMIAFIDGENDDIEDYLSAIGHIAIAIPQAASVNAEKSTNHEKKCSKRKINDVDLDKDDTPIRGTDNKFIFKNKQARKNIHKNQMQDNSQLKNEILELQKEILIQEIKAKSESIQYNRHLTQMLLVMIMIINWNSFRLQLHHQEKPVVESQLCNMENKLQCRLTCKKKL